MPQLLVIRGCLAACLMVTVVSVAAAQDYTAKLSGFFETGPASAPTGAILTAGTGRLTLDVDKGSATYTLTYSDLTSNVTQAHLHFGKVHVPGGIFAFLCTNLGNGPAGTPTCPAAGGTVSGTITAASIVAVPGQNISTGDFSALLDALSSNTTYANVHTAKFPGGEIRGQVQLRDEDRDEGKGR